MQQKNSSFSVEMEPQWQPKKAAFSMGCPTQWQQKNTAFSVDQKHQTWGKDFEKEINQGDKEKRSGIHEKCEEFGRMFREKL